MLDWSSPWVVLPAVIATSVLAAGTWIAWYPLERWRHRHIPGPFGLPLIGTLDRSVVYDLPKYVDLCKEHYGPVFKIWFGKRPWIVIADPEVAKKLSSRLLQRPNLRYFSLPPPDQAYINAQGVLNLRGAPWRVARKAFESAVMHRSALDLHMEVMQECVERLVSRISRLVSSSGPGVELNISPLMGDLTMDVVGSCVFGVAFNTQDDDAQGQGVSLPSAGMPYSGRELVDACKAIFDLAKLERGTKWVPLVMAFPEAYDTIRWLANKFPDKSQAEGVWARKVIQESAQALIAHYKEAKEQGKSSGALSDRSFLGMLLAGHDLTTEAALDEGQIVGQATSFLLAGYETTAATLMFSVYLLALHPEAQSRLHQELDQGREVLRKRVVPGAALSNGAHKVAAEPAGEPAANGNGHVNGVDSKAVKTGGSNEAGLNNEELAKHFPYTCAVIDEALRLFPPGASALRAPLEDIEVLGYRIPKESFVYLPIWTLHHDQDLWPRAAEFLPERHIPGNKELQPSTSNAYTPFGHGARSCPGSRFALQEARLALVRLFDRFRFELGPSQEVPIKTQTGITVAPVHGVHVRVFERKPAAA